MATKNEKNKLPAVIKKRPGDDDESKVMRPGKTQALPNPQPGAFESISYRGAVPLKGFVGWVMLVLMAALLVGFMAAQMLVSQRLSQLVEETSSRVELQAQGRAAVVAEWITGVNRIGDSIAGTETVEMFVSEGGQKDESGAPADPQLVQALQAQKPYMDQMLKEFVAKYKLSGAHIVRPGGDMAVSAGVVPEPLAKNPESLKDVFQTAQGSILPLRQSQEGVVMDVLRPIMAPSAAGEQPVVAGVLWLTLPIGEKLAELVAATPLDRAGERTAMLQNTNGEATVVGKTSLAPLADSYDVLQKRLAAGRVVRESVIDSTPVFATLKPIDGTPFALLQEYASGEALGMMVLYKPGLYVIVTLLVVVLAAMMLAMTLHLMGQRNRTRVKLLGQTMDALVRVVEARDPYLSGHHSRVARLAVQVGNTLHLTVGERATLFYAAQLSSVGRLLVPRDVLTKKGKLSSVERDQLEGHISQAIAILGDLDFDLPIVPVIEQMYEREDGSGHPHGLKGNEISRMGKILGACDAYVAMTSERAHRAALTPDMAVKSMAGGSFAKEVVTAIRNLSVRA